MKERQIKNIEKDLLDPLFGYFVKNGLENISIREICKNIDVSSGSLYYWFKGKDEIIYSTISYGLIESIKKLFNFAYEEISEPTVFFKTILDEVDKCKDEFRFVFQATTSPKFGPRIRESSLTYKTEYEKCCETFAEILKCDMDYIRKMVYMLVFIIEDYVIWEDVDVTKMQLSFLAQNLIDHINSAKQ